MADVGALQQALLALQQLDCATADPLAVSQALQSVIAFERSPHQITRAVLAGAIASPLFKILPSSCLLNTTHTPPFSLSSVFCSQTNAHKHKHKQTPRCKLRVWCG